MTEFSHLLKDCGEAVGVAEKMKRKEREAEIATTLADRGSRHQQPKGLLSVGSLRGV